MREDRVHQLFLGRLAIHGDDIALDQLGHFRADHMGAKQLAGLGVEDGLHEAVGLAQRNRLAIAHEGEAAHLERIACLLGLGLGEAHARHLRMAIGAAGDHGLFHGMGVQALDGLHADHALMLGLVGQHGRARHIADGVDAGHIGAAMAVGDNGAAIQLHADLFKAEILGVADHAHGGDHALGLEALLHALVVIHRAGDVIGPLLHLHHLGGGHDLDALLLEALARDGGDLGVLHRHDLRQHFDHRHLAAHGGVEAGEFDADGARAHDDQRLGESGGDHGLEIGPDQLAIGLDARQHARPRAGGNDDVLGLIGPRPQHALGHGVLRLHHGLGGCADRDFADPGDGRLAPDDIDLVLLQQKGDAAIELGRDPARPLHDRRRIKGHLALDLEAIGLGMLGVVIDLRRAQQRLGGDAAPVEADAAQMLALHHGCLEAKLGRANGGDITARPAADDEDVVGS